MPKGATIAIGQLDKADILSTAEGALKVAGGEIVFAYSCMSRYLVLGADNNAEAEKVIAAAGGVPYIFACSAGEICPLPDESGRLKNYFHNYAIIFCKLG
jgi:maleate cis-trans isomerase